MILDGATGTALGPLARGPLFSAEALLSERGLAALAGVHRAYVEAGAEVITAATFRTNRRAVGGDRFPRLAALAVRVAKESGAARVAGSLAPLADCYRPELRPEPDVAFREHAEHARALVGGGCDLLLVETVAAADEGLAAVEAASACGVPIWVAAMVRPDGKMRSGDDLASFFVAARNRGAGAALINCVPCDGVDLGLAAARDSGLPFGGYAHMGAVDPASGWPTSPVLSPSDYRQRARRWIEAGATLVGGCCGTTPSHVGALAAGFSPGRSRAGPS